MDIPLFIRSTDGVRKSKSHDFIIKFTPEFVLSRTKDHYIALKSLSISYSWYNISSTYGNNMLKYSHDGGITWTTITVSSGNYGYNELNSDIQQVLTQNNHSRIGILLRFIPSRYLAYITLEANY